LCVCFSACFFLCCLSVLCKQTDTHKKQQK
jgi:hypothetical protein